ncbi:MAG: hypothetical protein N2652_06100 [Kiritimatiellae bacterium]|nr:hypothetical protein [Kiritimatiellia bacterium]
MWNARPRIVFGRMGLKIGAMQPRRYRTPGPRRWLWLLALLIAAAGGSIAWLMRPHVGLDYPRAAYNFTIAATVVLSGLCVIVATADWWFHR